MLKFSISIHHAFGDRFGFTKDHHGFVQRGQFAFHIGIADCRVSDNLLSRFAPLPVTQPFQSIPECRSLRFGIGFFEVTLPEALQVIDIFPDR